VLSERPCTFKVLVGTDTAGNTAGTVNFQEPITFGGQTFSPEQVEDALFFKLDPKGGVVFTKQLSGTDLLTVDAFRAGASGDMAIAGETFGEIDLGGGVLSGEKGVTFAARFDPSGAHVWSKALPAVGISDCLLDAQGDVLLTGWFYGTVDFGGGPITSQTNDDEYVVKFGPSGEHLWSKRFGPTGGDGPGHVIVALDAQGNVYVSGGFTGTWDFGGGTLTAKGKSDAFLAKLDPAGNYLWARSYGQGDGQAAAQIAVDAGGHVLLAASFLGTIDFGAGALHSSNKLAPDIAIARIGADGQALWSRRFGQGGEIAIDGLAADLAGNVYVAGDVGGDIDFGTGVLPATGQVDLFVVKLAP
jgi:hypothetical protein